MLPTSEEYHEAEDGEAGLLELMAPVLSPGDTVLEAGCGRGRWANELARAAGCRVVGVDTDGARLEEGRQGAERAGVSHLVEYVNADLADLPDALGITFDKALSIHSLHEYRRPRQVLAAIHGSLAPGGLMLVLDYIEGSTAEDIWSERYYTPGAIRAMLEDVGFEPREALLPWGQELALVVASR